MKKMNISHMIIENMRGRDQSQVKIKFKKFEKVKSVPKYIPKSHNDDRYVFCINPNNSQLPQPAGGVFCEGTDQECWLNGDHKEVCTCVPCRHDPSGVC